MNLKEKVMEASANLRERAAVFVEATAKATRAQTDAAAGQMAALRKSLVVLDAARLELNKLARRHASRIVKQNSPLFSAVRRDVSELAHSTYQTLSAGNSPKTRRPRPVRKRARKAA